MNHMTLIARFAAPLCARFTVLFPFTLPAQDSIQQISDASHISHNEISQGVMHEGI